MNHYTTRGEIGGKAARVRGELRELIEQIRRHFPELAEPFAGAAARWDLKQGARHLVSSLIEQIHRQEPSGDDMATKLHRFMVSNLHKGLTLKDLAGFLGYSEKYCSDFFQARMGQPFSRYLKRLRLEKAERLLKGSSATLAQIAASIGFHDPFAFSHFFKKTTGYSPTLFRERHGKLSLPGSLYHTPCKDN